MSSSPSRTIDNAFASTQRLEALEARLGRKIVAYLSEGGEQVPHDISERLRVARLQALERARALRKLSPQTASGVYAQGAGTLSLGGSPSWWLRLASFVPLAVLVGGLLLIQHRYSEQQISAAAEIDAALLADELPPQAYSDQGFAEFLRAPQPLE